MVAHCAFSQCPCHWGGGLCVFHWAVTGKCSCFIKCLLFLTSPSIPFTCLFNSSSNTEEDTVLQTNKQIYSQLLRATANRNSTLLERIEVIICLLEQLASGSSGSSGGAVPWPKVVPEDSVSAFPTQSCSVYSVLSLIKYEEMPFKQVHSGDSFPTAGRGRGLFWLLPLKGEKPEWNQKLPSVFPRNVHGSSVIAHFLWWDYTCK